MNKAFTKEDEGSHDLCPRCGSVGLDVAQETWQPHVRPEFWEELAAQAFFCPSEHCPVVYFDLFGRFLELAKTTEPIFPKSAGAPLCACFGFTFDDIAADVDEGQPRRVRELLQRAQSPEAHCLLRSPSGRSCVGDVQRSFMKLWAQGK